MGGQTVSREGLEPPSFATRMSPQRFGVTFHRRRNAIAPPQLHRLQAAQDLFALERARTSRAACRWASVRERFRTLLRKSASLTRLRFSDEQPEMRFSEVETDAMGPMRLPSGRPRPRRISHAPVCVGCSSGCMACDPYGYRMDLDPTW